MAARYRNGVSRLALIICNEGLPELAEFHWALRQGLFARDARVFGWMTDAAQ